MSVPGSSRFAPLPPRRRLADELAAGIVTLIDTRGLGPGDQLDTVRALAARFEVAIPTIREALRRLEATGMVELRHGSGVYIGAHIGRLVLPNLVSGAPSAAQMVALLEARQQLEPPIAAKAAAVRNPDGLARLEASLRDAERCVSEGDDNLWTTNLEFHRALAAASGNAILTEVVESLLLVHAIEQREILRIHGHQHQDLEEHRGIAAAVTAGDVALAGERTGAHLASVLEMLRRSLDPGDRR